MDIDVIHRLHPINFNGTINQLASIDKNGSEGFLHKYNSEYNSIGFKHNESILCRSNSPPTKNNSLQKGKSVKEIFQIPSNKCKTPKRRSLSFHELRKNFSSNNRVYSSQILKPFLWISNHRKTLRPKRKSRENKRTYHQKIQVLYNSASNKKRRTSEKKKTSDCKCKYDSKYNSKLQASLPDSKNIALSYSLVKCKCDPKLDRNNPRFDDPTLRHNINQLHSRSTVRPKKTNSTQNQQFSTVKFPDDYSRNKKISNNNSITTKSALFALRLEPQDHRKDITDTDKKTETIKFVNGKKKHSKKYTRNLTKLIAKIRSYNIPPYPMCLLKNCLKCILFNIIIIFWSPCIIAIYICWIITNPLRREHIYFDYSNYEENRKLDFWDSMSGWINKTVKKLGNFYNYLTRITRADKCVQESEKRQSLNVAPNKRKIQGEFETHLRTGNDPKRWNSLYRIQSCVSWLVNMPHRQRNNSNKKYHLKFTNNCKTTKNKPKLLPTRHLDCKCLSHSENKRKYYRRGSDNLDYGSENKGNLKCRPSCRNCVEKNKFSLAEENLYPGSFNCKRPTVIKIDFNPKKIYKSTSAVEHGQRWIPSKYHVLSRSFMKSSFKRKPNIHKTMDLNLFPVHDQCVCLPKIPSHVQISYSDSELVYPCRNKIRRTICLNLRNMYKNKTKCINELKDECGFKNKRSGNKVPHCRHRNECLKDNKHKCRRQKSLYAYKNTCVSKTRKNKCTKRISKICVEDVKCSKKYCKKHRKQLERTFEKKCKKKCQSKGNFINNRKKQLLNFLRYVKKSIRDWFYGGDDQISSWGWCKDMYINTLRSKPCFFMYRWSPSCYPYILTFYHSCNRSLSAFCYLVSACVWCPILLCCYFCCRLICSCCDC